MNRCRVNIPLAALATVLCMNAGACRNFQQFCTEIGCVDSVSVQLTTADGAWPDGRYEVVMQLDDGQTKRCQASMPADLPEHIGSASNLECDPALSAQLSTQSSCRAVTSGDAETETCVPMPGRFQLELWLQSTPQQLDLRILRDGQAVLEQTVSPQYEGSQPNGPDCEPTCRGAQLQMQIP